MTSYLDLGVNTQQGEKSVHIYQGLPGLSVHSAQKIEGKRELEEQAIHHHQVSYSHCAYMTASEQLRYRSVTTESYVYLY